MYNSYAEIIMRHVDTDTGVQVGGRRINNIRYADNTVLIADSADGLQDIVCKISAISNDFGLSINTKKTKVMAVSKNSDLVVTNISVNGNILQQVDSFVYLGHLLTKDGRCDAEIKRRIEMARSTFTCMKDVLINRKLGMKTRMRIAQCYVWSTLLYGAETWTRSKTIRNRLQAFETWILRRMMRISWTRKMSNVKVYKLAGTKPLLLCTIAKRQLKYFGHIVRQNSLQQAILTGKIMGRRDRGRQRRKWTDGIKEWTWLAVDDNVP